MLPYILFVVGFVILIKGAALNVQGASSIARRLNISDLVIGLTIVAFGTSAPELFVNFIAAIKQNTDIVIGNILGSNIANILLILGISSIIFPLQVSKGTVRKEIPLSLLAALILWALANDEMIDGGKFSVLTRIDGIVFLSFFIIFLYYSATIANKIEGLNGHIKKKEHGLFKSILLFIIGLIGLAVGGKWIVDGAVRLAIALGVSQSFIGLTIIAVGSSLPELATSAVAAHKKNADIAVGNIVGSSIFNVFFVLGISSVVHPISFQTRLNFDVGLVILSNLLLFIYMFTGIRRKLDRWEGVVFVILYVSYIVFLIFRG